ncbi:MAG: CotH kinase family protein [Ignavibacteriales bacterium]|nr:CotH kinase family protein [Ignavibacteriales bacterium]
MKMMKTTSYILISMTGIVLWSSISYAQSFYDLNTVQTIALTFRQSNWDFMLDTAKAGSDGYIMAQSVSINGTVFDSVGVKYKGNSTYRPEQVKNPFHIELDTYKDQNYQGYTDVKLSNAAKDPSFLREALSYAILRQYMDASLSNYANVYVNGKLIGLYVNCESVSKKFVRNHFYSKDNAFFKCNPIAGAGPGTSALPNLVYLGPDSTSYAPAYEMNSDFGWSDLIRLCNTLKNNISGIETVLDVDRALWMLAFDNCLVNLDSYIGGFAQNYYLYKDNTGRFNCVLWDFNESFGTFSNTGTINLPNTTAKIQMTHLLHSGDANWPLVQKLLSVPAYKKMYLAHLQTILNENFSNGSYLTTARSYQPVIDASVQADPNKLYTYAQYQSNLTADVTSGSGPSMTSAPGIANLMNGRYTYLSPLSDFTNTRPSIAGVAPSNAAPKVKSSISVTATVSNTNANAVYLGYRYDVTDKFTKVLMYDDGAHGDGASGDNVYGATINVNSPLIQYYVYAENNNAGMFSPVRAEHEFYTIKAEGDPGTVTVKMNEIYSRGTTTDPDWIELYNTTTAPISLAGYKIYDVGGQGGTKPKKEIPAGTVIPATGFFVVVTDGSASSDFGLSSSGETVWLEDSAGTIVDTVNFAAMGTSQSYGRFPDGGAWKLLNTITRGTTNGGATAVWSEHSIPGNFELSQNYPNPFNPVTTIKYSLPRNTTVILRVYNLIGQEVAVNVNSFQAPGEYSVTFDASKFPSGIYFYRLSAGSFIETRKMILIR